MVMAQDTWSDLQVALLAAKVTPESPPGGATHKSPNILLNPTMRLQMPHILGVSEIILHLTDFLTNADLK